MKSRTSLVLFTGLFALACAGDTSQEGMAEDASAEVASETMSADEAAIDQIRMDYMQHYNMHHAPVVADLYTDSAFWLPASGEVLMGREAIQASMEESMAGMPTLDLTRRETMLFGDYAVALGDYGIQTSMEGTPLSAAGHYLTVFNREGGAWKITGAVTNYNAAPPEGMPMSTAEAEIPDEEGTMADLTTAYETHFNLGHADMVADLFTDDAVAALSNLPIAEGRAAISAVMGERFAMGSPKIDLHDVGTLDLGDGWAVDGGWYEINATGEAGPITQRGNYMMLARQQADGAWKIHWVVSNGQAAPAS